MQVAYTNHIGHSSRDTHSGKSNAISTVSDLGATERHNNHDYSEQDVAKMQSNINLELRHLNKHYQLSSDGQLVEVEGQLDLEGNVRKIYETEFHEAIEKYNAEQIKKGHPERQIVSYIDKISEDKQQEVAVEGLLQIGSLDDWQDKTIEDRLAVAPILIEMLKATLAELDQNANAKFILAGASLHLNEGTPHIHYVGVPIQESPESKRGLEKRVKKTAVFTKDTLGTGLQDNVRAKVEPMIEDLFGWTFIEKKTGRNEDRDKNTQVNEILKGQIHENQEVLAQIQRETEEASAELKKTKAELAVAAQTHRSLEALNASNLEIISQNDAAIAEQHQIFKENKAILAEQADLIGMYQSHEEYLEGGQKAHKAMDDIQEDLDELPKQAKLFHAKEAESWRQRTIRRLRDMMEFVKYTIGKLQIFEKQFPEEATEQLSVPAQHRAAALDTVIASAERQRSYAEDSDFRRKRKDGYDGQSSDDR